MIIIIIIINHNNLPLYNRANPNEQTYNDVDISQ